MSESVCVCVLPGLLFTEVVSLTYNADMAGAT